MKKSAKNATKRRECIIAGVGAMPRLPGGGGGAGCWCRSARSGGVVQLGGMVQLGRVGGVAGVCGAAGR